MERKASKRGVFFNLATIYGLPVVNKSGTAPNLTLNLNNLDNLKVLEIGHLRFSKGDLYKALGLYKTFTMPFKLQRCLVKVTFNSPFLNLQTFKLTKV